MSFVRRHEIFHYLFQRSSRILRLWYGEDKYKLYQQRVYGPAMENARKGIGDGALEEALAEAYAAA